MLNPLIPSLERRSGPGPLVTIVMPTYRRAQQIRETIDTLVKGTFKDFELLVRDDGDGTDGTEQAVSAVGDSRVRYHRNSERLGMPGNLNSGIKEGRGAFIAVCHDHDLYKPDFIETMVGMLNRYPSALFVHCAIELINQTGQHVQNHVGEWPELMSGAAWLKVMLQSLNCPVCALTVVRRSAHEEFGLYDNSCGFIADVEMWMRLASRGDVAYVRRPLISIRERESSHFETVNGGKWIRVAADIHRRYLPRAFTQKALAIQRVQLEVELGNKYLRHHASRLLHRLTAP